MDDDEDDEGPDGDCCPWREPADKYDYVVNLIACEIVGHDVIVRIGHGYTGQKLTTTSVVRFCGRFGCPWRDGEWRYPDNQGFRYLIDQGSMIDASYLGPAPVANGIIRDIKIPEGY